MAWDPVAEAFELTETSGCPDATIEETYSPSLVPWFGDADLRSIGTEQVEAYKAAKAKTLSANTVNHHLGTLSGLYTCAVKWLEE